MPIFWSICPARTACAAATGRAPEGACSIWMPRRCTPRSSSACASCRTATTTRRVPGQSPLPPDRDADKPLDGDLPPREQKLLLMRLAALYGPDALAYAPRAPRQRPAHELRGVGWA